MTAHVLEHRRVRAFADALEEHGKHAGPKHGRDRDPDLGELMAAVEALDALPAPQLDPEVRVVQRAHLVAAFENLLADRHGAAVPPQHRRGGGAHRAAAVGAARRTRWGRRLAFGGLAAGMAFGALGGVAAASSNALPGDSLYGMKRSLEGWQLDLAGSDAERGRLLLDQASTRMAEVQQLVHRGHPLSPDLAAQIQSELDQMNAEGSRGRDLLRALYLRQHSLSPMRRLAAFAQNEQPRLAALTSSLPRGATPAADQIRQLLSGISEEVAPLRLAGQTTSGTGPTTSAHRPGHVPGHGGGLLGGVSGTTSGTGTLHQGSHPSSTPNGGLLGGVSGLTSGVLNPDSSSPSGPTTHGSGTAPPGAVPGPLNLPPLVPGLLPGLGLGG